MGHFEFFWEAGDGVRLFGQGWQTESRSKAVVCLVHGLGEHSSRYAHLADYLTHAGYSVLAFDLRGNGKSQGQRGHTPCYEILLDDIAHLLDEAAQRFPNQPRFLYGHSLGGSLVLNFALRCLPQLAGVIATAPWLCLAIKPPLFKIILARIMNNLRPSFSQASGLDKRLLCSDSGVLNRYESDPFAHDRISARMFMSVYHAGLWAIEHAGDFPLPLLLMQGGADSLVSIRASGKFAADASRDCVFKLWPGLYHEIHNEPQQKEIFSFLVNWLERNREERQ